MGRVNDYIKYSVSGYRYAPESFHAYRVLVDKSGAGENEYVELDLSGDQRQSIGYTYLCKGPLAAFALAKRYDRAMDRKPRLFLTYGFLDATKPSRYHFTQQLYCRLDAPLIERLSIFKRIRDCFKEGAKYETTTYQLDGAFKLVDAKKDEACYYLNADLSKPVLVYLRAAG